MSKIVLLILIALGIILFLSGVVEIRVKPDKISAVPGTIAQLTKDKASLAQAKVYLTRLVRKGELLFAEGPRQKMELVLGYVEADSSKLAQSLSSQAEPKKVIAQAELLASSLEQAKKQAQDLSAEDLATLEERAKQAHLKAQGTLASLQALQQEYQSYQEQLTDIAESLEEEVGAPPADTGDVAGATDEESTPAVPIDSSEIIPLLF